MEVKGGKIKKVNRQIPLKNLLSTALAGFAQRLEPQTEGSQV